MSHFRTETGFHPCRSLSSGRPSAGPVGEGGLFLKMLQHASNGPQLVGGSFACPFFLGELVRQLLALVQVRHPGALDRADVNEHILAAIIRLNEAKSLLRVEPFDGSGAHALSFRLTSIWWRPWPGPLRWSKFRETSSVRRRAAFPRHGQVVRPKRRCG